MKSIVIVFRFENEVGQNIFEAGDCYGLLSYAETQ